MGLALLQRLQPDYGLTSTFVALYQSASHLQIHLPSRTQFLSPHMQVESYGHHQSVTMLSKNVLIFETSAAQLVLVHTVHHRQPCFSSLLLCQVSSPLLSLHLDVSIDEVIAVQLIQLLTESRH